MKKRNLILIVILVIIILGLVSFIVIDKTGMLNNKNGKYVETSENISENIEALPLPEVTGGERGKLGIDKNINENNIDQYLKRSDSVYRDMRMLQDPGNYEAIGGDSNLSGYIEGFEVVPLPYLVNVTGLPKEVGNTYSGETLYTKNSDGRYTANYEESLDIIEKIFPKDKNIFLICGGGGYAGMTKELLVALGWNENKIYNIGGFWYYDGQNKIEVKKIVEGKIIYEFDKVPYHDIKFDKLTKVKNMKDISTLENEKSSKENSENIEQKNESVEQNKQEPKNESVEQNKQEQKDEKIEKNSQNLKQKNEDDKKVKLDSMYYGKKTDKKFDDELDLQKAMDYVFEDKGIDETVEPEEIEKKEKEIIEQKVKIIENLRNNKKSFVVIVLNTETACSASEDESDLGSKFVNEMKNADIYCYKINLSIFKKTSFYKTVKYAPSIVVFNEGNISAYTDANKDSFDSEEQIKTWISQHIELKK